MSRLDSLARRVDRLEARWQTALRCGVRTRHWKDRSEAEIRLELIHGPLLVPPFGSPLTEKVRRICTCSYPPERGTNYYEVILKLVDVIEDNKAGSEPWMAAARQVYEIGRHGRLADDPIDYKDYECGDWRLWARVLWVGLHDELAGQDPSTEPAKTGQTPGQRPSQPATTPTTTEPGG